MARSDTTRLVGSVLASGTAGGLLVSLAVHLYNSVSHPSMLRDGQYAMIFMLTFPAGWALGAILYGMNLFTDDESERPTNAGWVFAGSCMLGVLAVPFILVWIMGLVFWVWNALRG